MSHLRAEKLQPGGKDSLLASRLGILARAMGFNRDSKPKHNTVVKLLDYSCYQFRHFIESTLEGLEFLHGQQDVDLKYLNLFTHICKTQGATAEDTVKAFREVFTLGSLTQLLKNPDLWLPHALDYERDQLQQADIDYKSAARLRLKLSRLMCDDRRCILGVMKGSTHELMLLFYLNMDIRSDYADYLEVAFKFCAVKESFADK